MLVLLPTFTLGSKYLLPSVKVGSKTNIPGHILAFLPSVQIVVRLTKQNPIWSKALTMPLTIGDNVSSYKQSSNF